MTLYLSDTQIHIYILFSLSSLRTTLRVLYSFSSIFVISSPLTTLGSALMDSMFGNCRACKSGSRILIEKAAHAPMFLQPIDEAPCISSFRRCIVIPQIRAISVCRLFDKTIVRSGKKSGYCCNNVEEIPYLRVSIFYITQCACKRKY